MTTSENLKRLASTFTVRDIMVSVGDLVCAAHESEAASLSEAHPEFSFIPIRSGHRLSAYYSRHSHQPSQIGVPDLIGDGTGLLDLVEILERRQFVFVLGPRQIDGYVHFSDLNHPLVKLTFHVLLEGLERFALDSVRSRLTEEYLKEGLGSPRFEQVQNFYRRAGDAGQSVINYLNIADALKLARRAGTLDIDESVIRDVKDVRDGAAHVLENLVSGSRDVEKLAQVKRQCLQVLRSS
jgi:hypothetical protein